MVSYVLSDQILKTHQRCGKKPFVLLLKELIVIFDDTEELEKR